MAVYEYKTEDGKMFMNEHEAKEHAASIGSTVVYHITENDSSGGSQGDTPDVLIEKGNMSARAEKYDGAISFYTQAINHRFCSAKDKSNAYEKRGYCYEQLKKHEQAVEDCTNAINIDNTIADAYLTRGFALIGKGFSANKEQAIANFKKAADLGSNTALKTLSQFGVQYTPGSGGYTLEAADLGNTTALENLADMGIKYIPAAIQAKENSSDSSVLWNLAFDYGKGQGGCPQDEAKAIELFTRVVEMDINYAYYLGNVYLWGDGVPKDQDKAIYWFEKAAQQGDHKKEAKKKLLELTGKKLGFFDKLFG